VVWASLPKPSVLSAELDLQEATVVEETVSERPASGMTTPLVLLDGGVVTLDPAPEAPGDGTLLCLRREVELLRRSLRPELVVTSHARSLEDLLRELLEQAAAVEPALQLEGTLAELLDREGVQPSVLGHGVAVPHTYRGELSSPLCGLARVPEGLDLVGHDGEPVRLVFLLLSPAGDPEAHLETLAEIARIAAQPAIRAELLSLPGPAAVLELVRRASAAE
jgi:PTS system nitrogen regulatory IIA component